VKLTKAWLKKWEACSGGVAWFENFGKTKSSDVMEGLLADKELNWANWLIARLLNRNDRIRYAVYAVEQVIDLFEKKYPEDKRPRQEIQAAKAILRKNNKGTRAAFWASSWAASWAPWDARSARSAAGAASWASWAAGDAAGASCASWAFADAMKEKIIRYGLDLHLKGGL